MVELAALLTAGSVLLSSIGGLIAIGWVLSRAFNARLTPLDERVTALERSKDNRT